MEFSVVVAARTGSSRLPGKALLPLQNLPMITFLLRRLRGSREAARLILATTVLPQDDLLAELARREGVEVFRGPQDDVVERYVRAAEHFGLDYVVRVTGDCPLTDAETLDYCLGLCRREGHFDLATTKGLFPVGIDYEVYQAATMHRLHQAGVMDASHREHLTKYFYDFPEGFRIVKLAPPPRWTSHRVFTVDTREDYEFCAGLAGRFPGPRFGLEQVLEALGA